MLIIFAFSITGYSQALEPVCTGSEEAFVVTGTIGSDFYWFVHEDEGDTITEYKHGDGRDTVIVKWRSDTGTANLSVYEVSAMGNCQGEFKEFKVKVTNPQIDLAFTGDTAICDGDSITLDASDLYGSSENYIYVWRFNDVIQYNDSTNIYSSSSAGTIAVRVEDTLLIDIKKRKCYVWDTCQLIIRDLPTVDIREDNGFDLINEGTGRKEFMICGTETKTISVAYGYETYYWWAKERDPLDLQMAQNLNYLSVTTNQDAPIESDTIYVDVTDRYGCINTDSVYVYACSEIEETIKAWNSFTPNGDGINDTWVIKRIEQFTNAEVEIFDRWGRIVYKSKGFYKPWDGKYKGRDMPMDSYYYVIDLHYKGLKRIKGTVNLIR
jgi:gliding motility-associated-like protein